MNKMYIRDKRSPEPKSEAVSKSMSHNKAKDSKPELVLRRALWHSGFKGYRLHIKDLPGKPDIVYKGRRIAIFVNGCFWHRCPYCHLPIPKNNHDFWSNKFNKNIERDKKNIKELEDDGWNVLVIWECEIKDMDGLLKRVKDLMLLL